MTKCSIWWSAAFVISFGLAGCGGDDETGTRDVDGSGGVMASGGTGGAGGTGGTGGDPGSGDDDCNRVCESPCVEDVLPTDTVDDCIRACRMDSEFQRCLTELVAIIACLETIGCGSIASPACLPQSGAFTSCLGGT